MYQVSFTDEEQKLIKELKEFFKYADEDAVVKAGIAALRLSKEHIEKRRALREEAEK
jgi:hypothetical protein